jgi:hypothetical protein
VLGDAVMGLRFLGPLPRFVHHPVTAAEARAAVAARLGHVRDRALNGCLTAEARGGRDRVHAVWSVPGSALVVNLLEYSAFGRVGRWFSQIDPAAPSLHPRYRWSARLAWLGSRVAARPLPAPTHAPLHDPRPIVPWLDAERSAGRTPHLHAHTSAIVELCQAGGDLAEVQFACVGEPATAARLSTIRATGAAAWPLRFHRVRPDRVRMPGARGGRRFPLLPQPPRGHPARAGRAAGAARGRPPRPRAAPAVLTAHAPQCRPPRVGAVDPETAVRVFLDAVGAGRPGRVPSLAWADGDLLRVERRPPVSTDTGKIQHLHAGAGRARGARAEP